MEYSIKKLKYGRLNGLFAPNLFAINICINLIESFAKRISTTSVYKNDR